MTAHTLGSMCVTLALGACVQGRKQMSPAKAGVDATPNVLHGPALHEQGQWVGTTGASLVELFAVKKRGVLRAREVFLE
jgi:hypothetical protein